MKFYEVFAGMVSTGAFYADNEIDAIGTSRQKWLEMKPGQLGEWDGLGAQWEAKPLFSRDVMKINEIGRGFKITNWSAFEILKILRSNKKPAKNQIDAIMERINTLSESHGVEAISGPQWDSYWVNTHALYVNTGDTYSYTILYDCHTRELYPTTWGDWLENYEVEYGMREDNDQEEE